MAKRIYTYIIIVAAIVLSITGCTDGKQGMVQSRLPHDTLYTEQKAIAVYGYDPVRALQIVDSAVIVGNMSSWRADKNRARIYSQTQAGERLDSLMHWTPGARLDTARIIGEQLIRHDSIKNSLERQQERGRQMLVAKIDNMVENTGDDRAERPYVGNGTYFVYYGEGAKQVAETVFGPSLREGVCYTSEELSRKQIVPRITEVLTGN